MIPIQAGHQRPSLHPANGSVEICNSLLWLVTVSVACPTRDVDRAQEREEERKNYHTSEEPARPGVLVDDNGQFTEVRGDSLSSHFMNPFPGYPMSRLSSCSILKTSDQ